MDRAVIDRVVQYFETLTRESVTQLPRYYAADAYFKDPFDEVRRVEDIQAIFDRMFDQLDVPRFKVEQTVGEGRDAFLIWELQFRLRGRKKSESIRGVSHLRFGADGKVSSHRDYWDTAEELYQKIPLLGACFRWLRRRASEG